MAREFSGVHDALKEISKSLAESRVASKPQERGEKRKSSAKSGAKSKAPKKSALQLLKMANDSEDKHSSDGDRNLDSELDQGNPSDGEVKSKASEGGPQGASAFVPSKEQKEMWCSYLKRGEEHGPQEWKKIKVERSIRKWTTHKEARGFKAPARNLQLPRITSFFNQEREKGFATLQSMMGAQAAITLELWGCISKLRDQQVQLIKSSKQAIASAEEGPGEAQALELAISNFTDEAKAGRAIIDSEIAIGVKDSLRLSAVMFSKVTLSRRKTTIKGLANVKGARERLEECQPSD